MLHVETRLKKKTVILSGFLGILLILLCPLVMYSSHDVSKLKDQFPHLKLRKDDDPEIEIRPGRPSNWVSLKGISPYGKWAIIFSEDWSFYTHEGFDLEQMKVALSEMIEVSRFRGASTITQQMVKNVYLYDYPLFWRKFHEIILSKKVEEKLSKPRILEVYLNVIEFGPGIFGIKAASRHYFKKSPSELTPRESAFLAMLLPSPKRYYVSFKKKTLTPFAKERVKAILIKMRMGKILTPAHYEAEVRSKFSWEK